MVLAAPGKQLVDFGLRRAHGAEAGLLAARACYMWDLPAPPRYSPANGSVFQSTARWRTRSSRLTMTERRRSEPMRVATAQPDRFFSTPTTPRPPRGRWRRSHRGSGDGHHDRRGAARQRRLAVLSWAVRGILDKCGLPEIKIFVSGGLDENSVAALLHAGAPIDGFGIGTSLTTSSDAPALDCVYKLEEYAGAPAAQAFHRQGRPGPAASRSGAGSAPTAGWRATCSRVESDRQDGEPLLELVMQDGRRLASSPFQLAQCRARAARELARFRNRCALGPQAPYPGRACGSPWCGWRTRSTPGWRATARPPGWQAMARASDLSRARPAAAFSKLLTCDRGGYPLKARGS